MQDSASFWTDIKLLEEQLAKAPDSLCFARLSAVYLKVGLVDDALHVARQGVKKHPSYLSGQRALSLACHAKGLNAEALAALKLVTAALPEDVPSQKLVGRLLVEAGNPDAACQAFRTALEFAPDDVECRIELEYLERSAGRSASALEPDEDDEPIIEDLEMLEDEQPEAEFRFQEAPPLSDSLAGQHHDPLTTGTLAELYVTQGFIHKALEIYRAILSDNPADRAVSARVAELEALEAGPSEPDSEIDDTYEEETGDQPAPCMSSLEFFPEIASVVLSESDGAAALETPQASAELFLYEDSAAAIPSRGVADNALATLDRWLVNIGRIKACR